MQQGQFRYAVYDANSILRETVKLLLQCKNGCVSDNLLMNIKTCERRELFGEDKEFMNKIYEIYHICNNNRENIDNEKYLNYRKVRFVIMQLKNLLNVVEREIIEF